MRDIRGDLEERANLCKEQIRAAHTAFESIVQKLQRERDTRIADLKSVLRMIERLLEFENSHIGNVVTLPSTSVQHLTLAHHHFQHLGINGRGVLGLDIIQHGFDASIARTLLPFLHYGLPEFLDHRPVGRKRSKASTSVGTLPYFGVFASRKSRTVASSCSFVTSNTFSMYCRACDTELVEMETWASPFALTEITNFLSCGVR
jgi:hypothetical protein